MPAIAAQCTTWVGENSVIAFFKANSLVTSPSIIVTLLSSMAFLFLIAFLENVS